MVSVLFCCLCYFQNFKRRGGKLTVREVWNFCVFLKPDKRVLPVSARRCAPAMMTHAKNAPQEWYVKEVRHHGRRRKRRSFIIEVISAGVHFGNVSARMSHTSFKKKTVFPELNWYGWECLLLTSASICRRDDRYNSKMDRLARARTRSKRGRCIVLTSKRLRTIKLTKDGSVVRHERVFVRYIKSLLYLFLTPQKRRELIAWCYGSPGYAYVSQPNVDLASCSSVTLV